MVFPASFKSLNNSNISFPVCESNAPVGSSANNKEGLVTSARAIATRCC